MGDGERMLLGSEPSTYYLTCNTTAEPFNNADLRRGISLAINREAICKTIFKGTRTPADGIVPPGIAGYKEGAWEFCAYDVDKANEYLDKVAPAGANGDRGINVTLSYNQDGGHKEIMESIIGDLAKVGVTAVSDTPEWSALLEQYQNFNYQFGRLGWIADYPIMDNFLYPLFHSDSLGGDNRSGYNNSEFDAKVDEARATVDDDERIAKMQEADAMVAADCPVIPVMFYTHTIVAPIASSTSMSIRRSTPIWVPLSSPKSFAASMRVKYLRRLMGNIQFSLTWGKLADGNFGMPVWRSASI